MPSSRRLLLWKLFGASCRLQRRISQVHRNVLEMEIPRNVRRFQQLISRELTSMPRPMPISRRMSLCPSRTRTTSTCVDCTRNTCMELELQPTAGSRNTLDFSRASAFDKAQPVRVTATVRHQHLLCPTFAELLCAGVSIPPLVPAGNPPHLQVGDRRSLLQLLSKFFSHFLCGKSMRKHAVGDVPSVVMFLSTKPHC